MEKKKQVQARPRTNKISPDTPKVVDPVAVNPPMTFVVYGLYDRETNMLRYIGQTTDPLLRKYQHTEAADKTIIEDTRLGDWLRKLRRSGKTPRFDIIEVFPDAESMYLGEQRWIEHHRKNGAELLNHHDGGRPVTQAVFVTLFEGWITHDGSRWRTETITKKGSSITNRGVRDLGTVYGVDYGPDKANIFVQNGQRWLNLYVPPNVVAKPGQHLRIDRLIRYLCSDDLEAVRYLTHWIARKVQNPERKNMTAIVLQGQQGTGKDTLALIIMEMVGRLNCARIGQMNIESRFNSSFVEKLLVVADEVVNRDNLTDTASTLKQYITDETVRAEQKFVPAIEVKNRMSWIFTSNATTPVKIEGEDDRRYSVFQNLKPPPPEHREMLSSMYGERDSLSKEFIDSEVSAFMQDLMDLKVDMKLLTRPYENEARRLVVAAGQSSVEAFGVSLKDDGLVEVVKQFWFKKPDGTYEDHDWHMMGRCQAGMLYLIYKQFCVRFGYGTFSQGKFSTELKRVFPELKKIRGTGKKRDPKDSRMDVHDRPWVYDGLPTVRIVRTSEPQNAEQPKEVFRVDLKARLENPVVQAFVTSGSIEETYWKLMSETTGNLPSSGSI